LIIRRTFLGLLAVLAGCASSPDACDGVAGTCASIDVYGNGVGEIDQLRITVNGQTKSTPMLRHALPVEIAATFPPALTGNQSVDVVGLLNGNAVGEGAASLVLSVGAHAHAMVTLSPLAALDGGAPVDLSDAASTGCKTHAECASGICQGSGACAASGDVLYVDNVAGTCTGAHLGNQTDPICDFPQVIGKPFVHVAGSTHAYSPLTLKTISVVLVGPGGKAQPSAKIVGGASDAVTIGDNTIVTLDGFEIAGSLADAIRCLTFSLPPSSSVTLKNSYVHDVSYFALELQRCDLVIDRSQLGPANASGAVSMTYGNYSITNAFIVGNGGPAMVFSESAAGVFSHDTVVGNVTNGSTGGFNCSATGVTAIDNSIVWMNSKLNGSQLYGTCALTNVDIDEVVGGAGNRSVAPDFVSAGFDYHLGGRTANNLACCVDQIVASAVDHDYDGRARPVGGKWDVGAHEVP